MKGSILVLVLLCLPLHAQFREWRNASGDKSITGKFVKRDGRNLTIMKKDLSHQEIPFDKLHAADIRWLDENHPLSGNPTGNSSLPGPSSPSTGVIDELRFGDSRAEVTAKLLRSPMFQSTVAETFLGRTGLNGIFRTRQTIGGMHCFLYFDWNDQDGLSEITLQTEPREPSSWDSALKPCLVELVKLLTSLHGKPLVANESVDINTLQDGGMTANHLWNLEPQGSVLLGPAKQDGKLHVAVRFTSTRHEAQPDPNQPPPQNP